MQLVEIIIISALPISFSLRFKMFLLARKRGVEESTRAAPALDITAVRQDIASAGCMSYHFTSNHNSLESLLKDERMK
jgi:hypothetical protein